MRHTARLAFAILTLLPGTILADTSFSDDVDVHTYLPELVDYEHTVTVRQMVHHAAGMGDYDHPIFTKADGSEVRFGNEDYLTNDEFHDLVIKGSLAIEPGTEFLYSNLGYYLLSKVVARVSGQSLRDFAAANIFGPLGMASSQFVDNVNLVIDHRADGYRQIDDGSWQIYMTNNSWVGDGGVYTTIDDFIAWDRNFYSNRLGGGSSLIALVETPMAGLVSSRQASAR
jgi:CubicO group peptidase (beta-lactamase class C family)